MPAVPGLWAAVFAAAWDEAAAAVDQRLPDLRGARAPRRARGCRRISSRGLGGCRICVAGSTRSRVERGVDDALELKRLAEYGKRVDC